MSEQATRCEHTGQHTNPDCDGEDICTRRGSYLNLQVRSATIWLFKSARARICAARTIEFTYLQLIALLPQKELQVHLAAHARLAQQDAGRHQPAHRHAGRGRARHRLLKTSSLARGEHRGDAIGATLAKE